MTSPKFNLKTYPFLLFIIMQFQLIDAQVLDSSNWHINIAPSYFKVYKNKHKISKEVLDFIDAKRHRIASSNGKLQLGCVIHFPLFNGKYMKMNWIAKSKDKKEQYLSLSYGGKSYYTKYFAIRSNENKTTIREMAIDTFVQQITFEEFVRFLKADKYEWTKDRYSKTEPKPNTIQAKNEKPFDLIISTKNVFNHPYLHKGDYSPDSSTQISYKNIDPASYQVILKKDTITHLLKDIFTTKGECYWSKSGKYVVFNLLDLYDNSGTQNIVVVNVFSGESKTISREEIIGEAETEKREKINIHTINWVSNNTFTFSGNVSYLGESGHPGINYNRMSNLGENYNNTSDTVALKQRYFSITNDTSKKRITSNIPPPKKYPLEKFTGTYPANNRPVEYYICFKKSFHETSPRIIAHLAKDSTLIELQLIKDSTTIPLIFNEKKQYKNGTIKHWYNYIENGYITGRYTLTIGEKYTYLVYTNLAYLKEVNYTFKHNGEAYPKQPCIKKKTSNE